MSSTIRLSMRVIKRLRNINRRCVICGRYKIADSCLICRVCTIKLCKEEWGEDWGNE